jgi:hypothetical protein
VAAKFFRFPYMRVTGSRAYVIATAFVLGCVHVHVHVKMQSEGRRGVAEVEPRGTPLPAGTKIRPHFTSITSLHTTISWHYITAPGRYNLCGYSR